MGKPGEAMVALLCGDNRETLSERICLLCQTDRPPLRQGGFCNECLKAAPGEDEILSDVQQQLMLFGLDSADKLIYYVSEEAEEVSEELDRAATEALKMVERIHETCPAISLKSRIEKGLLKWRGIPPSTAFEHGPDGPRLILPAQEQKAS